MAAPVFPVREPELAEFDRLVEFDPSAWVGQSAQAGRLAQRGQWDCAWAELVRMSSRLPNAETSLTVDSRRIDFAITSRKTRMSVSIIVIASSTTASTVSAASAVLGASIPFSVVWDSVAWDSGPASLIRFFLGTSGSSNNNRSNNPWLYNPTTAPTAS
jgi:hypothetical protein